MAETDLAPSAREGSVVGAAPSCDITVFHPCRFQIKQLSVLSFKH